MSHNYFAHPTAIIDAGAVIGDGSRIWHWVHVCSGATLGTSCILGQNVFVGNNVSLGNNVKVQNNVSLYEGVEVEDDVFCGPSMVFTNVYNPRAAIEKKNEFRITRVRRGATIGANATIVCGVEIGEYAFIGAGSLIRQDVPPFALMVGNPGRQLGWADITGERLPFVQGTPAEHVCPVRGDIYRFDGVSVICEPATA